MIAVPAQATRRRDFCEMPQWFGPRSVTGFGLRRQDAPCGIKSFRLKWMQAPAENPAEDAKAIG
jgi:hypothetical protein